MSELGPIREFRSENFKSFRTAALRLSPLTVMIGPNASGKSNLIEGLRLLSWLAGGRSVDEAPRAARSGELALRGDVPDYPYYGEKAFGLGCSLDRGELEGWSHFDVGISTVDVGLRVVKESVHGHGRGVPLYEIVGEANRYTHDIQVAYNNFARGGHKPQIKCTDRQLALTQLRTPARFGKGHAKSQELIPRVAEAFAGSLNGMVFLDPVPSEMRGYSHMVERVLDEKGKSLSSVLYDICRQNGREDAVLAFVRELPEQDIGGIDFIVTERRDVMVRLKEVFAGRERDVAAPVLSDGTLRVLAIAAALLSAPEGALVVIEEIDNGVHPSRARLLLDSIFSVSKERKLRVLLTTHNPALLDALPADAVPKVACCYRDPEEGHSRLVHLEDLPSYPELVARGLLGRLMTTNVIDRFLKDSRSSTAKAEAALAWLQSMEEARR